MERAKACPILVAGFFGGREGELQAAESREGLSTDAWCAGGLARSSCDPPAYRSGLGSEGAGLSRLMSGTNRENGGGVA
jgi:hypothetical protein